MSHHDDSNTFLWFLAGLGLGAVVGVLYAPKSGAETRAQLAHEAEQGREYLMRQSEAAREQAARLAERGKESWNRQREQLNTAVEAGKQAYREATKPADSPQKGGPAGV